MTDYTVYKGYEVLVYSEYISGVKKNGERPAFHETIEWCEVEAKGCVSDTSTQVRVILLVSELSRLGRNAFEVFETVKERVDFGINLYMQKEQMTLLVSDGKPSIFVPIMHATISTCAQSECDSISFRLNSGKSNILKKVENSADLQ